jgi:hypothetical protein
VQIQEFALGGPHAPPGSPPGTLQSNVFQLALSPDGHTLYAISQSTNPNGAFAAGNQLHILSVAADGTLSEPHGPVLLSSAGVPGNAHPQGVAVVTLGGSSDEGRDAAIPSFLLASVPIPDLSDLALTLAHLRQQAT